MRAPPDVLSSTKNLSRFRAAANNRFPSEGLGRCILNNSNTSDPILKVARAPLARLGHQLSEAMRTAKVLAADPADVMALLGLGPGLTPSGDDVLGGMMIGLHGLGKPGSTAELWNVIEPVAAVNCNAMSYAHLKAAAGGHGAFAIHSLMSPILQGVASDMQQHLANIDAIGHSSGWDTMASVVTVLDPWLNATSQ